MAGGLLACGYSANTNLSRPILVDPVRASVASIGTPADVERALNDALARRHLDAAAKKAEPWRLRVRVVQADSGLARFSEPAIRAGQYDARMRLEAVLIDTAENVRWRGTETMTGAFLSTPGPLERFDGAERRALDRAAVHAAERLVDKAVRALGEFGR